MKSKKRQICLFGLSANPPTGKSGHVGIVSYLSEIKSGDDESETRRFDEIRVLPVYKHMYSAKKSQASYEHRLAMCRLAFGGIPNVTVSDEERIVFDHVVHQKNITAEEERNSIRVGTIDLLDYLISLNKAKGMEEEFTLAMGADTFMDLTTYKWKRSKDIIRIVGGRFIVKCRESDTLISTADVLERIERVNNDFRNEVPSLVLDVHINDEAVSSTSSSAAREVSDESELSRYLDVKVIEYIKANELYKCAALN